MPELSRAQLLVYGALAVVALLLGARWIRSADASGADVPPPSLGAVAPGGGASDGAAENTASTSPDSFEAGPGEVVVHVAGAVRSPGVYRLPGDSRVTDAIERAGGGTAAAVLDAINLAAKLADGQQVVVPARARSAPSGAQPAAAGGAAGDGPISLGTATVEQLEEIEGIGPVTAQNIVDFRDERGGLSSIDELDELSGIGPATMGSLRDRLQP